MSELALFGGLLVAFVNGANDNFKGVATLHGCGALSYRRSLLFGTAATALGGAFALPLGVGPLVAILLAWAGLRGWKLWRARKERAGGDASSGLDAHDGSRSLAGLHLASGGFVSFARGLNDTPKILGLLAGASIVSPVVGVLLITGFMAAGGLLAARRVGETLAQRITPMTPAEGLVGNAATAALVIGASRIGLPVSTTHVSTGSIFGIGADNGRLRWRAAGQIAAAWMITLPLAALLSASALWGLS